MPCTTILVGKKASIDGSTMIARNDDGGFDEKKLVVTLPEKQPRKYTSVIGHLTIELPDNPMRYTSIPNVNLKNGLWPACGFNAAHVAMTATETITSNPRVMGADPMVRYKKAEKKGEKDIPGGIGEEDLVLLVLPYIKSAREGVLRLGSLLEKYGTYESNGIAFSDENEVWWLETIGGHHWIARRVQDEEVVIMPNQFGLDRFDLDDAEGKGKDNLCSADLRKFIEENHLNPEQDGKLIPRTCFGSHSDEDHIYNTPRAWYMARYFMPTKYHWDGENADFNPESDNIPWAMIPEKKVAPEDIKYLLSSYFQGTPYNPYTTSDKRKLYRPIGVATTDDMAILQIRGDKPDALKCVEWLSLGPNPFNVSLPLYADVESFPKYISQGSERVSTDDYYWSSRLVAAFADMHYNACVMPIERYQGVVACASRSIINEYDEKIGESGDVKLLTEANEKLVKLLKTETDKVLKTVAKTSFEKMAIRFRRDDN